MRSWEVSKAGQRMGLSAYRSGLYKRAVVLLQHENHDSASRASTAHSLQKAISIAHTNCTADSRVAPTVPQTQSAAQQQVSSDKEKQRREAHNAKLLKQQLRRQRQQQRHEQNKRLWQQRHEEKVKSRQEQLEQQAKQQRQQQVEAMQQLEQQRHGLCRQLEQHKQDAAAIMEAPQNVRKDLVAAPLESLTSVQDKKSSADEQLTKVLFVRMHLFQASCFILVAEVIHAVQAIQAGEHMSRRAASIEPEDGECTPSPNAVQQPQNAARHHAMAPPPVMQALPPPPPAAPTRSDTRYQIKVCVSSFGSYLGPPCWKAFKMPLLHLACFTNLVFATFCAFCCPGQETSFVHCL